MPTNESGIAITSCIFRCKKKRHNCIVADTLWGPSGSNQFPFSHWKRMEISTS